MKIIISPAKIQKPRGFKGYEVSSLLFKQSKDEIHKHLKRYDLKTISKVMKIKGDLLKNTHDNIHENENIYSAIDLYSGIVFKEMNIFTYDSYQLEYMNSHLRILSAYYGVLIPSTGVKPYRLDMSMKFKGLNLKNIWCEKINAYFEGETIINLASKEFSSIIKLPMINIHFKEEQSDGTLRIVTVRAKKARGLMVDYLVQNTIEDIEELKKFCEMGYVYDQLLSTDNDFEFILPYMF